MPRKPPPPWVSDAGRVGTPGGRLALLAATNGRPGRAHFRPIPGKFAEIAALISERREGPDQSLGRAPPEGPRPDRAGGGRNGHVEFFDHPTDDAWCRDHGPIFVRNVATGEVAVTDWRFQLLGGQASPLFDKRQPDPRARRPGPGPAQIRERHGARGGLDRREREGAAADDRGVPPKPQPKSPDGSGRRSSAGCGELLGVHTVLWLGEGIAGDDTDGHVDDLAGSSARGIVTAVERTAGT